MPQDDPKIVPRALLAALGPLLGHLGAILAHLGAILAPLRAILGVLGRSWGDLGASWGRSWATWDYLGAILEPLGAPRVRGTRATHSDLTGGSAVRARRRGLPSTLLSKLLKYLHLQKGFEESS